ncbi:rhomboid family intramembrane serine protease GlpG [Vibrio sp.]|uniref:rhomboid family intramembrane serine protease GlpG n=1 Tax=Vibrio sp. TaxID=678 RepID=UPI003D126232
MLRLASINNPRMAQAFIDYMASQGVEVAMMPEGEGQFALWLLSEEHQMQVEAEWQRFIQDPLAPRYQAASWELAETRQQKFAYHSPSMLSLLKAKAGPVTLSVMVICLLVFVLFIAGMADPVFNLLHFPAVASQQWQLWRWVTHALLHFSVLHIVFNLLWWWQLGGDVEKRLGPAKLLQIMLVSAALSGAGQFWVEGANFGGLSGVVYALVGYLWLIGVRAPQLGLGIPKPILVFMLVWMVLGFVQPYMAIANTAHLVGFGSGLILALLDASKAKYQRR